MTDTKDLRQALTDTAETLLSIAAKHPALTCRDELDQADTADCLVETTMTVQRLTAELLVKLAEITLDWGSGDALMDDDKERICDNASVADAINSTIDWIDATREEFGEPSDMVEEGRRGASTLGYRW